MKILLSLIVSLLFLWGSIVLITAAPVHEGFFVFVVYIFSSAGCGVAGCCGLIITLIRFVRLF
jgi:hypothetical protein